MNCALILRCIEVMKSRYIGTIILGVTNCELPELCHYTYLTATGLPVSASHSFSLGVHAGRVTPVYSTRVGTGIGRYLPALVERIGRLGWKVAYSRFIFSRRGLHGLHPSLGRRVQSYPSLSVHANQVKIKSTWSEMKIKDRLFNNVH